MRSLSRVSSQTGKCQSACQTTSPAPKRVSFNTSLPSSLSFLLILLPKCPFCLVAYSSSLAMCGISPLVSHHTDWGAWAAFVLGGAVLYGIYRNYRGTSTIKALMAALIGLLFVAIGVLVPFAFGFYYAGAMLLFVAAFYNGSGFRIINQFIFRILSKARNHIKVS